MRVDSEPFICTDPDDDEAAFALEIAFKEVVRAVAKAVGLPQEAVSMSAGKEICKALKHLYEKAWYEGYDAGRNDADVEEEEGIYEGDWL